MSSSLKPPVPPLRWSFTPDEIIAETKAAVDKMRTARDQVAALPASECTFDSVFVRLAEIEADALRAGRFQYYSEVASDEALRDTGDEVETLLDDFKLESSMRSDLYNAKVAARKNIETSGQKLGGEEQLLVERMILDGKRAGLGLSETQRDELKAIKKELSQTSQEFMRNLGEDKTVVSYTREELDGVAEDVISGYNKRTVDGKELFDMTLQMPQIAPVLRDAINPETRKRAYNTRNNIPQNVPLFEKTLGLRLKLARLLGYASFADYIIEENVAKTAKAAYDFIQDLEQKLTPLARKEVLDVLALKRADFPDDPDCELYGWDWPYYDRLYKEKTLGLDMQTIKEHFPVEAVVPKLLDIYQELLGLRFVLSDGEVWHPDTKVYAVWEKDAIDDTGFCGYFYLDLYSREGKDNRASTSPLIPGYSTSSGSRNYPVAAVRASLAAATPLTAGERPALMSHMDTTLLFHEMGHIFHELLSVTRFARFHGTISPVDFAESPSQMLENWCWDARVLGRVTSHWETGKPLGLKEREKLANSRRTNVAMFYMQQVFMAKYDLMMHLAEDPSDPLGKNYELRLTMLPLKSPDAPQGFGSMTVTHLMSGYEASFYSYLYSLVYAQDMWATVFEADPLDPAAGQRYRKSILQPGASRDELVTLEEFLGRPPKSDAFVKVLFGEAL